MRLAKWRMPGRAALSGRGMMRPERQGSPDGTVVTAYSPTHAIDQIDAGPTPDATGARLVA